MREKVFFALLICLGIYQYWHNQPVAIRPGATAPDPPIQRNRKSKPIIYKGYTLRPVADIEVTARILSKREYLSDIHAVLSKTDLALGWRNMSDPSILSQIDISQSNRFVHLRPFTKLPISRREMIRSHANMHLIPATATIQDTLDSVSKGQIIHFSGKLIHTDLGSFDWKSSTRRDDTGAGACEIVYVDYIHSVH